MIGNRINTIYELLKSKGLVKTKKDFCQLVGIEYTNLARYVDGRVKFSLGEDTYIKLKQQNVNINWLLTGEGEPFLDMAKEDRATEEKNETQAEYNFPTIESGQYWLAFSDVVKSITTERFEKNESKIEELDKRTDDLARRIARLESRAVGGADEVREPEVEYGVRTVELPLAENLAAGLPREAFESGETFFVPENYLSAGARYCVARISGDSMTQLGIYDGSYVLLRYSDQAVAGKVCVVRYGDDTTLKKLENTKEGGWQLVYCDGSDTVIPLVAGDWEVLGEFVRVLN